jgi:O-antigen ligase
MKVVSASSPQILMHAGPDAAVRLFLWAPLLALLVPQSTVERSLVGPAIFGIIMSVAAAMSLLSSRRYLDRFSVRGLHIILLVALIYFLPVSSTWSLLNGSAVSDLLTVCVPFCMWFAYYLLLIKDVSFDDLYASVSSVIASGVVLAALTILVDLTGDLSSSEGRATSLFGFMTLIVPAYAMSGVLAFARLIVSERGARLLPGLAFGIIVYGMLLTVTRGLFLGLLIGCLTVYVLALIANGRLRFGRALFLPIVAAPLAALLFATTTTSSWTDRLDPSNDTAVQTILGRLDEIQAFSLAFEDSPIIGQGIGARIVYPSEFDDELAWPGLTIPHNHLAFFLAKTGVVGAFLYYGLFARGLSRLTRGLRQTNMTRKRFGIAVGFVGAIIAGLIFTFTSTTYTTISYNAFVAIFLYAGTRMKIEADARGTAGH